MEDNKSVSKELDVSFNDLLTLLRFEEMKWKMKLEFNFKKWSFYT